MGKAVQCEPPWIRRAPLLLVPLCATAAPFFLANEAHTSLLSAAKAVVMQCRMTARSHKNMQRCPNMHLFLPAQYKQAILCMSGVCRVCSVDDMVVAAVISLQDPVGSGPDDICAWIEVRKSAYSPLLLDPCVLTTLDARKSKCLCPCGPEEHSLDWHPAILCSSRFCWSAIFFAEPSQE